jgi:DNA-binding winged helix-turn-helix (wHTH) protein
LNFEAKSLTCITGNGITHKPQELSTLVYKILTTLAKGFTTKEELVTSVWGYQYDQLRHDSLIYSSFSSLRKILGQDANLIETSEMGYKLNAKILNLLEEAPTKKPIRMPSISEPEPLNDSINFSTQNSFEFAKLGLNARQIQILAYLQKNQFIAVKNVISLFSTSEITANRDLRSLSEKKLVVRIGQGRATQYTLTGVST